MAIIYSDEFRDLVAGAPLVYVDAGARGGLEGPWARIADERIHVLAFEPDAAACAELKSAGTGRFNALPKALWSQVGTVPVHLAETGSTSSVHPPNFALLDRFPSERMSPRTTVRLATVDCTSLDVALAELDCQADFIKLDTQGAEFEILQGATRALDESVFGVVAESWTVEVHKGQKLTGDILNFMQAKGFGLFDLSIAAAWHRRSADRPALTGKREIVGLDLLFLREPTEVRERFKSPVTAAKAAAIAELYGLPDLAIELLGMCEARSEAETALLGKLRNQILGEDDAMQPRPANLTSLQRLRSLFRREKPEARSNVKLHY